MRRLPRRLLALTALASLLLAACKTGATPALAPPAPTSTALHNAAPPGAAVVRTATTVVCASDAVNRAQCDYVADGVDDQVEIQRALDNLPPQGGRVYLSEGAFYLNNQAGKSYAVRLPLNSEKGYVVLEGSGKKSTVLRYNSSRAGDHMFRIPFPGIDDGVEIANMQWTEWDNDCDDEPPKHPCPRWAKALATETPQTVIAKSHIHDLYVRRWGTGVEVGKGYWGNWHDIRFQGTLVGLEVLTEFNIQTLVNVMSTGTKVGLKLKGHGITVIGSEFNSTSDGVGIWLVEGERITLIGSSGETNRGASNTVDLRVEPAVINSAAIGFNSDSGVDIRSPTFSFANSRNEAVWDFFPESLPPLERWQEVYLNDGWAEAELAGSATSSAGQYIAVSTGALPNSKVMRWQRVFGLAPGDYVSQVNWAKPIYILMNLYRTGNDPQATAYIQLTQTPASGDLVAPGVGMKIANLDLKGQAFGQALDTVAIGVTLPEGKDVEVVIAHIPSYGVVYMVNGRVKTVSLTQPKGTLPADYRLAIGIANGPAGGVNNTLTVYRMRVYSGK